MREAQTAHEQTADSELRSFTPLHQGDTPFVSTDPGSKCAPRDVANGTPLFNTTNSNAGRCDPRRPFFCDLAEIFLATRETRIKRFFFTSSPPMKKNSPFDLCSAFVESSSFWHDDIPASKTEGPVITISQAAGARGNLIAGEIIRLLRTNTAIPRPNAWTLFNQSLIRRVVEEHRLPKSTIEFFPEDRTGHLADFLGEALGLHPGGYSSVAKTAETILRLAQTGNAVIVGRGGNFITRNIAHSLHVRLVGTLEVRIRNFARIYKLAPTEAAREVARRDRGRKNYILENFREDINDPLHYDLILNTDDLPDPDAARIIIQALELKFHPASKSSRNGQRHESRVPTPSEHAA